ncbi:hypothetical protein HMN09_01245100 [Mycena chlorophos]|uniref:NAD(P)-binding protein n=1 Tax=Mycena chlorophos TaxID=658473 RepID=A0A8H6S3G0_MYCCL|nr:hypothetical protein HMN09_01245100 [Mycena chlorophos]
MSVLRDISPTLAHANSVSGKVVVITGAANGIGLETARLFAQYGAKIVIGDISSKANTVVEGIIKAGGQAIYVPCNVLN